VWALLPVVFLTGCPEQVRLIAQDPSAEGQNPDPTPNRPQGTTELEEDEKMIEPDHPAVKSPQERALVHLHTPVDVCSGILVAPKLVVTAHQCFAPDVKGAFKVPDKDKDAYRVEVASSTLTWTVRRVQTVITPACDWRALDLAILVLDDAAPEAPVSIATAPSPGANIQALGFGKCRGDTKPFSGRTGTLVARDDAHVLVDVMLCQGDVGGGVFDTGASGYVGVVSRKGERREAGATTTIVRFDTQRARDLLAAADSASKGDTPKPVACE
jgi:hypothetical protein